AAVGVRGRHAVPASALRAHRCGQRVALEAEAGAPVTDVLETRELAKDYGDQLGLDPTTVTIGPGELVLLVGPNGAGKSTFLGLCGGLLEPTGGEVLVSGAEVGSLAARAATAVMADERVLYDDLSVWEPAASAA